ncbi:hypothetical protein HDV00_000353 [Rhizophlyctis rosea]|nr:hypothetical protein HDV00_000353 [Rhizophlyctis rosea]
MDPVNRPGTPRDAKFGHTEASNLGSEVDRTVTFERAHDWNGPFKAIGGHFRDTHGRTLLVRGVNVSGNSKLPTSPPGSTHLGEGFYDHRNVSFVGRPFPLDEVDENFGRLRAWGLTFIRLLVPWEALEHSGPGIYDEEYIDYLITVLKKAPEYGIKCFIDPHQDTWSRFSGGSGAPGWTFEVAGLDLTKFMDAGAAYVHQKALSQDSGHFAWPTNYQKLASATMFTLFFGGDIFAPRATYNGEPVQQFLQRHFCACFQHLATRQHGVWTIDAHGEPQTLKPDYFSKHPSDGRPVNFYIDCYVPFLRRYTDAIKAADPDLFIFFEPIPNEDPPVIKGGDDDPNFVYAPHWYDLQALFTKSFGFVTHDVQALSRGTKNVLAATYFGITGANKNYKGQIRNIVQIGITKVGKKPCLIGECGIPMDLNEKRAFETGNYQDHTNFLDAVINAMEASLVNFTLWNYNPHNDNEWGDHWNGEDFSIYSPSPTASRSASPSPSRQNSRSNSRSRTPSPESSNKGSPTTPLRLYVSQPKHLRQPSTTAPITPFDITDVAIEEAEGERAHSQHVGGRALDAVIRPYAAKVAGEPILMRFDLSKLDFTLEFERQPCDDEKKRESITTQQPTALRPAWAMPAHITEIFVPNFHYGNLSKLDVVVSDGEWKYNKTRQTLYWRIDPSYRGVGAAGGRGGMVKHTIRIRPPGVAEQESTALGTYNPFGWIGEGVKAFGEWCRIL